MKALFGISIDNKRYRTDETIFALDNLLHEYSEIYFFVADDIQLYNKATQLAKGKSLKEILESFNTSNNYYPQREKWILSLKNKVNPKASTAKWKLISVSNISDSIFHRIFRNILISFQSLHEFNSDVIQTAMRHSSISKYSQSQFETHLSIAYILEEIAINIRLRVFESIQDEYYLGELPLPLMKLYENKYPIDIFTLAGSETLDMKFNFYFSNSMESKPYWIKYQL